MKKYELLRCNGSIIRVLEINADTVLVVDCIRKSMPKWRQRAGLVDYEACTEQELASATGRCIHDYDSLDKKSRRFVHEHFTLIAGVLPFIGDDRLRCSIISSIATEKGVSKQTIRNYLWLYLVYKDIAALAPKQKQQDKPLTQDEKNMRWALNKFF